MLDKEAASINLDANPFKGSLREPLLRVIALMRGMEVTSADGHPIFSLADMDEKVGMAPHSFPTVFSFYLPEYTPSGSKIAEATLVAPESMIQDMPKVVGLLNGLYSLIKYGLSECDGGFGWTPSWMGCNEGNYNRVYGHLGYSQPFDGSLTAEEQASKVISELATILTSGRLAADSREIIKAAYIEKLNEVDSNGVPIDDAAGMALRLAQQLIVTTPEFHTTNVVTRTGDSRPDPLLPEPTGVVSPFAQYQLMCRAYGVADIFHRNTKRLFTFFLLAGVIVSRCLCHTRAQKTVTCLQSTRQSGGLWHSSTTKFSH